MTLQRVFTDTPQGALVCEARVPGGLTTPLPQRPAEGTGWVPFTCRGCGVPMEAFIESKKQVEYEQRKGIHMFVACIAVGVVALGLCAWMLLSGNWGAIGVFGTAGGLAFTGAILCRNALATNEGVRDFRSSGYDRATLIRTHRFQKPAR